MASLHDESMAFQRTSSHSSEGKDIKEDPERLLVVAEDHDEKLEQETFSTKYKHFILGALALLILGWWISATILPATRHRWVVQTIFAWFFILVIAFRFLPNTIVTRPVEAIWIPAVQRPWLSLSYPIRLTIGWLSLIAIVFGSAFGFKLPQGSNYSDRVISIAGLFIFQFGLWLTSKHRSRVPWPTVIVGLFLQQAIALFVLKTGAGFSTFDWIATLARDFLEESYIGGAFFFDQASLQWFFVSVLSAIIFFVAFIQMMYYLGVMQWVVGKFAWFFFKVMGVSGAEAVVAAASPWVGQGESACLVRPYIDLMTDSELHVTMTSGFSTIAGSVLIAYISLGVPPQNLITSSVMSIPASMAISKIRIPETEEPVTRGKVVVDRGKVAKEQEPANALHAFSQGALFGVIVAGQVLANVLTVLSLVAAINGLLTWIGHGFGIHQLTLQLVVGYILYPLTFFLGVPRAEILKVSQLFATKLIANEFAAYTQLSALQKTSAALSPRAYTIASYGLCGFANFGSLGIQIGVLGALGPSKGKTIARIAFSAMLCGFLSTLQTAGIAGMLL